ncbi:phage protein NinX family protein [Variovorax sp. YR566]|jgi:hypothetical protein|uniref:phage protein NinX family protein n=1 Tax=Variovorax sp. YR566 TaxID=3450237 RepID=UPI003F7F14DE
MKVSEAAGTNLDYLVAKAEGLMPSIDLYGGEFTCLARRSVYDRATPFQPSSSWQDAGPIIDRERICLRWLGWGGSWKCIAIKHGIELVEATGENSMIAAMRVYVISLFGDMPLAPPIAPASSEQTVFQHLIGKTGK